MTLFNFQFDFGQWWPWREQKLPCVLVIEDNPDEVEFVRYAASSHGFAVECVRSAEDALKILRDDQQFDRILIDVNLLGGMDGWDLRRQILALWPKADITVMSEAPESFHRLPRGECISVLIKPLSYMAFFEVLKK